MITGNLIDSVSTADDTKTQQLLKRYERALTVRKNWVDLFEECYEYALPQRESFYSETAGQRRDDKIFDETAVVGVQEFASRLQAGMVPNFARWADLMAGSEVPKENREQVNSELEEVTDYVFEVIQNSNFAQEVHESFMDLAVGTGVLLAEEGDAIQPVRFSAIPLPHVALDVGPDDNIDHIFRERLVRGAELTVAYPRAKIPAKVEEQVKRNPEDKRKVLEIIYRDYSKLNVMAHHYCVVDMNTKEKLLQERYEGIGSCPIIAYRWSKASGEIYGRGPLINALSAIKTTNLTVELILENAQMAISGIYQMEDDGIINPDSISLVPGTVIPKSAGSAGLQPINSAGRFDVADLVLGDMRNNIKRALYNDMLGDPNRTPASATEIAERMADLSRRIGSAFGRLQAELVTPVLQRVVYILKKQGRIDVPTINGREVKIRSVSPLAQAQAQADVVSVDRFLELVGGRFGPQILNLLIDSQEVSIYLARKFGVPDNLIRSPEQRAMLTQMAQQMAQMQQQQGMEQPVQ
tara:strand:- start:1514 stop:3088 length:1575 start_codon:yes stop_codon:yes gene_type:complete